MGLLIPYNPTPHSLDLKKPLEESLGSAAQAPNSNIAASLPAGWKEKKRPVPLTN